MWEKESGFFYFLNTFFLVSFRRVRQSLTWQEINVLSNWSMNCWFDFFSFFFHFTFLLWNLTLPYLFCFYFGVGENYQTKKKRNLNPREWHFVSKKNQILKKKLYLHKTRKKENSPISIILLISNKSGSASSF